jgi:hypothetical protein
VVGDVTGGASPAGPATGYSGAPAYYAYTAEGDIYHYVSGRTDRSQSVEGRAIEVRATATGKLVARVSPPEPYNNFKVLSGDASGHEFVFGAEHVFHSPRGTPARKPLGPLKFLLLRVAPDGRPELSSLSLPIGVTPGEDPSIALSPDGTRLAVAGGGGGQDAAVAVVTLATGHVRTWYSPGVAWAPGLNSRGAWTANGRTLALQELGGTLSRVKVYLLDTAAPGNRLAAAKLLVLRSPAGELAPWQPSLTPDGTALIAATSHFGGHRSTGDISVYSARTGALLRRVAPWTWLGAFGVSALQPEVAWSDRSGRRLVVLLPHDGRNVLGVITGTTFTATGSAFLAQRPSGYQQLQSALRTAQMLTW